MYIAGKWVAPEMPPWAFCFWRLALACVILIPIVHRHYEAMMLVARTRTLEVLLLGAVGLTICQGLIYVGLDYTGATTAGIIMALSPVMTLILARFLLGEPLGIWKAVGVVISLAGMLVIVSRGDLGALMRLQFNLGELLIVGSAFCWGLYTVLLRRANFGIELLPMVVLLLGAGAIATIPFYVWELVHGEQSALHSDGLIALAYVAGPGGALVYYLYNRSVATLGAGRAGMLLYLQSLFVAILAYFILDERLHGYDLIGAAFIIAGVLASALGRPAKPPAAVPADAAAGEASSDVRPR